MELNFHMWFMEKTVKVITYVLFILIFIIALVALLIWNAKTGSSTESFLSLIMLTITGVTCSILFILDIKK